VTSVRQAIAASRARGAFAMASPRHRVPSSFLLAGATRETVRTLAPRWNALLSVDLKLNDGTF
jgi:hypothetical protein